MGMPIRPSPTKAICDTGASYPQHRRRTIEDSTTQRERPDGIVLGLDSREPHWGKRQAALTAVAGVLSGGPQLAR
jgi:hypothetical protein